MAKGKSAVIDRVSGREKEYIIKDSTGITAGRLFIIEHVKESKYCTMRLKFYRENDENLLREALNTILLSMFHKKDIYKVNVLVEENINTNPFVDLGFSMEGVIEDTLYYNGTYRSELLFGITLSGFEELQMTNIIVLRGNNIELRLLTPEDSEDLMAYYLRNKEHLKPFEPARDDSFYTLEVQRKILMESYKQFLNGVSVNCGIYKEGNLIGKIQISNIVYGIFRSAFIGYSIDKNEQGHGYAKEALSLMLDYAFEDLELHRIEASTLVDNIRSQKVLKGCGFEEVGINKDYLFINGGWKDHITFYKLKK
jgi:[ribosomal protein S5]-alanine N-acetyltransferase